MALDMLLKKRSLKHFILVLLAGCTGCTPQRTTPSELGTTASRGNEARVGWVDAERVFRSVTLPGIASLESHRDAVLRQAPRGLKELVERAQTLEDQIAALPVGTALRAEKLRLLMRVRSEVLLDDNWQRYLLWAAERIDASTAVVRDEAEAVAHGEGLALVLTINLPKLDEATGLLRYDPDVRDSVGSSGLPKAGDVTDLVRARLTKRFSPEAPTEKHSRAYPASGEEQSTSAPLASFAKLAEFSPSDMRSLMAAYKAATGFELDLHFEVGNLEPLWLRPFSAGQARWMLLLKYPGRIGPPAAAFLQAHLFDAHWNRLSKETFPTGRGFRLGKISVEHSEDLGEDILTVHLSEDQSPLPERPAGEVQRYALYKGALELVRAVNQDGALVRRDFRSWFPDRGKLPIKRSAEEWQSSLLSSSIKDQLIALVWLTGLHLPRSSAPSQDPEQEAMQDSLIFENVCSSKETARILGDLKNTSNPWVRQYAELGFDRDH